ncbi:WYL domain-containing protein [Streptomyces anthocyanicus]|uniref:WYL domain-containing protein n=1 Tax=Streptomyces anthocyanicus TaxID=68174 RepID=UPI0034304483
MKLTGRQTQTKTLTDLFRALTNQHAVTVTYTDDKGETTVRTVELHEIRTNGTGGIDLIVMCRLRQAERKLSLAGVSAYTVHRGMAYVLDRPAPTTYERPEPQPADDVQALFFYELARDKDDADYRPRVRLAA